MAQGILSGMRVVEAAAFVAAPLGGMTLAQMGADVIRIDPPGGGLDYRRWPITPEGHSLFWCGLNKSKRSVVLNLGFPEGREIAQALITAPGPDAGIFVTNFPPRGWLDHEVLSAKRADLIQLTLQGDRHGGSAVDYTVNAMLGVPQFTGPSDSEEPVNHVLPAWDLITGQMVSVGLLAAERHRLRTGQGQHVKLALADVGLAVMQHLGFIAEVHQGQPRQRHGNELFGAFGRDFMCADGVRVMLVGLTGKQWRSLLDAMGLGSEVETLGHRLGLDLTREGDRFKARRELSALIRPWVAARSFAEVGAALDAHGVCWSRYQSIEDLVRNDPECSIENTLFTQQDQPGVGSMLLAALPLRFESPGTLAAARAPLLGEHTEAVLSEVLGIDTAQYGRLFDRGVVGERGTAV